jgi:hypothetical protein
MTIVVRDQGHNSCDWVPTCTAGTAADRTTAVLLVEQIEDFTASLSAFPLNPNVDFLSLQPTVFTTKMPTYIDLLPLKDRIISLSQNGASPSSIYESLNLDINPRTLRRRLLEWGQQQPPIKITEDNALYTRVKELIFQVGLSDKALLPILYKEGFIISGRILRRVRKYLGIRRRTDDLEEQRE